MGVFEKLPYLNYHDINLDWLVRQTKKNASDNSYLMKIFKWFQDQGLVGTVTNVTENPDDTVKIDYADFETQTTDDFTVYDKTGADNAILSGVADGLKSLGDLPTETDLQDTDLLLINRSGVAEAIAGDVVAKQSDMDTAEQDILDIQALLSPNSESVADLDAITTDPDCMIKLIRCNTATLNTPSSANGGCIHIGTTASYATQFFVEVGSLYTYYRIRDNGTWSPWYTLNARPRTNFTISATQTLTLTFSGTFNGEIHLYGGNDNNCGMIIVRTSSAGTVYYNKIGASNLTVSKSGTTLTIQGASTTSYAYIIWSGGGSLPTGVVA